MFLACGQYDIVIISRINQTAIKVGQLAFVAKNILEIIVLFKRLQQCTIGLLIHNQWNISVCQATVIHAYCVNGFIC